MAQDRQRQFPISPYLTRTFFRRNVGTSKSSPSTIVGSLFSNRPRVAGSNCSTSCFGCTFFDFGFGGVAGASATGAIGTTGFFLGGIKRGPAAGFFAGAGACSDSLGGTGSNGIKSCGGAGSGSIETGADRKSTRLNSSHANISYAVFC